MTPRQTAPADSANWIAQAFAAAHRDHRAGRLAEAEAAYRRILDADPTHVLSLQFLGLLAYQTGHAQSALELIGQAIAQNDRVPEFHYNIATVHQSLQQWGDAARHLQRAITLKPDFVAAHFDCGNVLMRLGETQAAIERYQQALALAPDYAEAHNNLGIALREQGRLDDAITHWRRALALRPDDAAAANNLGIALDAQGRLDEAEAQWRTALKHDPAYAEANHNLGNALLRQGRWEAAAAGYHSALRAQPGLVEALAGLAEVSLARGDVLQALDYARRALRGNDTAAHRALTARCLRALDPATIDAGLAGLTARALTEAWGRPADLAYVVAGLIKRSDSVGDLVARAADAWPRRLPAMDLFGADGLARLANDGLLCGMMQSAPVCDIALERFLTVVRAGLLERAVASDAPTDAASVGFACALARQCFINEYVFAIEDGERERAAQLRDTLDAELQSGADVSAFRLAVAAAYGPLHALAGASRLREKDVPQAVAVLVRQQLLEPADEAARLASISRLTTIDDTSMAVMRQYEENPYPRWIETPPPEKGAMSDPWLRRSFPSGAFDMLIAGCGTGQHAIESARRYPSARVLAVDLSLPSLAYAQRKTDALGVGTLDYAQADILHLGLLGRSFDVIEASGVLHHLAEPLSGWRELLSLLRPGGFMRLGLYSDQARRDIVAARAFITASGYRATADDIRRARQALMDLDADTPMKSVCDSGDFFTMSACRDLLFHVQEARLSIPEIKAFLEQNGLRFLGFDVDSSVRLRFQARFVDAAATTDLASWHTFETENPSTFSGMYQFWIQKG